MNRMSLLILPLVLLFAPACAGPTRIEGPWRFCPAPPARAHDVVTDALREFGYDLRENESRPDGFRIVASYEDRGREITQIVEARPAGAECEVRIVTLAKVRDDEAPRGETAHDRLLGRIDNAFR